MKESAPLTHFVGEAKMDLWEAFSELPDPRTGPAQRHDLREMIVMALGAVLSGCNTWVDDAFKALHKMKDGKRRLPWPEAEKVLNALR